MIAGPKLLGPVARRLICPDRWTDEYPSCAEFAQELDELLQFADLQGQLKRFAPRLECGRTQRDEALEELRVAFLLYHTGFPIVQWDPPGLNGKLGEYLISTLEQQNVFVEVKSPGWEGELSQEQLDAGRAKQEKYRQGEGGAFGNWQPVQRCIASENTYPKFAPTQPNLLIIADDLKVSLHDSLNHVDIALYNTHQGYGIAGSFTSGAFENLGGLGVFRAILTGRGVEYEFKVFDNPFALPRTKLPNSLLSLKQKQVGIVRATFGLPARTAPPR
jgi:hypothetical protein